jgi:hypothetical protein
LAHDGGIITHIVVNAWGLLAECGIIHAFFPESAAAHITAMKTAATTSAAASEESVGRNKERADQNEG